MFQIALGLFFFKKNGQSLAATTAIHFPTKGFHGAKSPPLYYVSLCKTRRTNSWRSSHRRLPLYYCHLEDDGLSPSHPAPFLAGSARHFHAPLQNWKSNPLMEPIKSYFIMFPESLAESQLRCNLIVLNLVGEERRKR